MLAKSWQNLGKGSTKSFYLRYWYDVKVRVNINFKLNILNKILMSNHIFEMRF